MVHSCNPVTRVTETVGSLELSSGLALLSQQVPGSVRNLVLKYKVEARRRQLVYTCI